MRHGKKFNHLGRQTAHRQAMLANMAISLIENKRITTTLAKAKALRGYVEPLITKAKDNTMHSRRTVMSYLQNKESITTLFGEVAGRINDRPGGYTRIIKLDGNRLGDAATMCIMELVDFNEIYTKEAPKKAKTRRGRRSKKSDDAVEAAGTTKKEEASSKGKSSAETKSEKPPVEVKDAEKSAVEKPEAKKVEETAEAKKVEATPEKKVDKKEETPVKDKTEKKSVDKASDAKEKEEGKE